MTIGPARFALPPAALVEHPAIGPLIEDYHRLTAAVTEAYATVGALTHKRDVMLENERSERAAAIREGKPDPGTKRSDKLTRDIETQTATAEATRDAITDTRAELLEAVEKHRDEWAQTLEAGVEDARDSYLTTIAALETAHAQLASAANLRTWLRDFPNQSPRWRPTSYYRNVQGLPGRGSEEALDFETALAALRDVGAPPAPPAAPPQHVPPGGRQSGRVPREGVAQVDVAHGSLHPSAEPAHGFTTEGNRVWSY